MDSTIGQCIQDTLLPEKDDIAVRDEELAWLMRHERTGWKLRNGRLIDSNTPTALENLYAGITALPPAQNATSVGVTATATPGVALWNTTLYTPIPSNAVMAPSIYQIWAAGTVQTSTTGMTSTLLPGIGNVAAGAAPSTYKSLGPSGAMTLASTALTALWRLAGELVVQQAGTAGTAVFYGTMMFTTAAAPATNAQSSTVVFGGTQATAIDFTGSTTGYPGGFLLASWASAATVTWVPQIIALNSLN